MNKYMKHAAARALLNEVSDVGIWSYEHYSSTYMTGFFSIYANLALVKVRNKYSVAFLVVQILRLPLDFICDAPPFLWMSQTKI